MKTFGFLIFIGLCLIICAGDKKEMSADDEKRLILHSGQKRNATADDEQTMIDLAIKYNQAERNDDISGMERLADEMCSFASQFSDTERGRRILAGANVKKGIVYCHQKNRVKALEAFDVAISNSPDAETVMYAYSLKLLCFWSKKYVEEIHGIMDACRKEYEKIKTSEEFRKDPEFRQSIQNKYSHSIDGYCSFILHFKGFGRIKKIIHDFIADFKSEDDFGRTIDNSASIFFLLAETFREKNDFEKELFYLKKSFHCAKQGKFVGDSLYLRLAAYEVRRGNYEQALAYCDSGLTSKQFLSNPLHAERQAILLIAKSKIYEKMGRPETAREYVEKSRMLCQAPNLRKLFDPWWIKE
ncbi:MAG: tetratricopeptide repeat protein [Lentisphaeria bacterium]|nr:tetratricopeptide repeat protein [Lentisphaeria bacterium]